MTYSKYGYKPFIDDVLATNSTVGTVFATDQHTYTIQKQEGHLEYQLSCKFHKWKNLALEEAFSRVLRSKRVSGSKLSREQLNLFSVLV